MKETVVTRATPNNTSIFHWKGAAQFLLKYGGYVLLLWLCIIVAILSPTFFTKNNIINIFLQTAAIGLVAIGVTFVIIVRGIDVSVGAIVALASVLGVGTMKTLNLPWFIGVLIILVVGVLCGFVNGFSSAKLRMTSFLVTLATLTVFRGLVLAISRGKGWYGLPDFYDMLGSGFVGPIPNTVVVMLLGFVSGHILLSKTVFGRQLYAVGGNPDAARIQGINVDRIVLLAFIMCGLFSGVASLILTARLNAFTPLMGTGFEFAAIAAAVIGGVSLYGGEGNMAGVLVGVLIIGVINNALNLLSVSPFYQDVARGVIIFVAVLLNTLRQRWSR
jgi:ribose transport system permease protein